ncbi:MULTISPECIES: Pvc16 family protein [Nostoc]|uniref:DUF4255 domain-containing protein n=1 Tax=Nostoc paludosum FACHB-159 TaxID=2692908 RepID=A0ABR8KLA7_9NOSO|nr:MULTISPECIES: Pvc16 family protein [Nostoc]MBD2683472.1 DUF4255 domain-containing protein [Nostoc sp. FACHB-857]MBD2739795.1 DUF4255 domain-containing protein [Nostoc paludosum FACHB-159]
MLISLLQTIAEILVGGTSLTSIEQIDFNLPGSRTNGNAGQIINLYLYDIRLSNQLQQTGRRVERMFSEGGTPTSTVSQLPTWFDVSLMLTAWDRTTLGEYHLLTEAMTFLIRHGYLKEEFLPPELCGYGQLPMTIVSSPPIEVGSLWSSLNLPLRPALYLTVTAPLGAEKTSVPLIWERIVSLENQQHKNTKSSVLAQHRVSIAGIVKNAVTNLPLSEIKVTIRGTEKSVISNQEGLFWFDNLSLGNYVLILTCPGYVTQTCHALVDEKTYAFKEVALAPEN